MPVQLAPAPMDIALQREAKVTLKAKFGRRVTGENSRCEDAFGRAGGEVTRAGQQDQDRGVAARGAKPCT